MSLGDAALIVSWVAITLLALAMAGLLRQVRELTRRLENPGVEVEPAGPRVLHELTNLDLVQRHSIVLFAADGCKACDEVLPTFDELAAMSPHYNFVVMFDGDQVSVSSANVPTLVGVAPAFVRLGIPVTPFAVVTDDSQTVIQAAPVGSSELLRTFVATAEGVLRETAA